MSNPYICLFTAGRPHTEPFGRNIATRRDYLRDIVCRDCHYAHIISSNAFFFVTNRGATAKHNILKNNFITNKKRTGSRGDIGAEWRSV